MRLIFIRHAEPDYEHNTLTPKGFEEARILARRTAKWNVHTFYCSPLERAQYTAAPTLAAHHREAITLDWLQEFYHPVDPSLHPYGAYICWDFSPEYMNSHPELYHAENWRQNEIMVAGNIGWHYDQVIREFDALLASYGYVRDGLIYRSDPTHISSCEYMRHDGHTKEYMVHNQATYTDDTLVFFCHLGISLVIMSHLLNVSPVTLWQGFYTAPTAVSILTGEERTPGTTSFRCQVCGDTSHLTQANEPISYYGAFAAPFQE